MIDCTKTENYFAEKRRMTMATRLSAKWGVCKLSCKECPLFITNNGIGDSCTNLEIHYPKKASEFLKYYPNAQLRTDGTPNFCPYRLGLSDIDECSETHNCIKCWNQPVKESEGK